MMPEQSSSRRRAESDSVEKADVTGGQSPLVTKHGSGDAHRVLLKAVEQTSDQDQEYDLLVSRGRANLVESTFKLFDFR